MKEYDATEIAYKNGYEAGYADGEIDFAPKWIPVTERLPEMHWVKYEDSVEPTGYGQCLVSDNVLVYCSSDNSVHVVECVRSDENSQVYWDDIHHAMSVHPTHWMPLPEPPKGE